MSKNAYHDKPLQCVDRSPAPYCSAKVAKVKKQTRSCDGLRACQSKGYSACKQSDAMAAADAAEAVYKTGYDSFIAGISLSTNPHLAADAMRWVWQEGWLDAQAEHGYPRAVLSEPKNDARRYLAAFLVIAIALASACVIALGAK